MENRDLIDDLKKIWDDKRKSKRMDKRNKPEMENSVNFDNQTQIIFHVNRTVKMEEILS